MTDQVKISDVSEALGLNTKRGVRMPIVLPGTTSPLMVRDPERPDEPGEEAYLELMSEDSKEGQEFDRKESKDAVLRAKKGRAGDRDPIEWQVDKVCSLLVGWRLGRPDGTPLNVPFTDFAARRLMSDPEMAWLRKEALVFVSDSSNFTRASSKS